MLSPGLLKARRLLTEKGLGGAVSHARTVALHKAHAAFDRRFPILAGFDPTETKVELSELQIASDHRDAGVHYLPTPWRVLDWVHEALPEPGPEWSFVDLGCGKGRVLVSAGRRGYGRVAGVEFAPELAATARQAVAGMRWRVAGAVDVIEGDATAFELPMTSLVIFLFNPFGPPVIDEVARRIAASWRLEPRPIIVAYLNPQHDGAFAGRQPFHRHALPPGLALKLSTLSPYRLSIHASPEAMPLLPGLALAL